MKKIVRQQNYLKELIESQANHYLSKQAQKCLVRSILEPLLDAPESGVVLYRIEDNEGLTGLLRRLEFSDITSISYSDSSKNLVEKVWANTEFICVMTHRYVAILIWDTNSGDKDMVRYYSLYNSKLQNEFLDIVKRNSKVDISEYQAKYTPDRRENILFNAFVRRLLENLEDAKSDAVLGYAEKSAETLTDADYAAKKSRVAAHEIRNQLSISDLYIEIIKRQIDAEDIDKDGIKKALENISRSLKMTNNTLFSLKSDRAVKIEEISLQKVINDAVELSSVYLQEKNIRMEIENSDDALVLADEEKLIAVIINLVKNASEAFLPAELEETPNNDKYIKFKTEIEDGFVTIAISNNAPGIRNPERIFDMGFTTKSTGSGLGLWICKKSIEEQLGELTLERSTEDYTEFVIKLGRDS